MNVFNYFLDLIQAQLKEWVADGSLPGGLPI